MSFEMKFDQDTGEIVIRLGNGNSVRCRDWDAQFEVWLTGGRHFGSYRLLEDALHGAYAN